MKYNVNLSKTNKDELQQPDVSLNDVLPKLPFSSIVIGRSGSGKTQSMVSMLKNEHMLKDVFDFVFLFCGVKPDKEMIKDLEIPNNCIFEDFNEEDVKEIIERLDKFIEHSGFNKDTPSTLMIFDDCLNLPEFLKSKTMTKLATANRHLNITFFLLSQYYRKLPPVIRTNASYIMFFPACESECEKLVEEQCPANMSKKQFMTFIKHATSGKHDFISINNKSDNKLRKNFDILLS
jgi:hypothetical protein